MANAYKIMEIYEQEAGHLNLKEQIVFFFSKYSHHQSSVHFQSIKETLYSLIAAPFETSLPQ